MMGRRRRRWGRVWQIDWKAWTDRQHWQEGKVTAQGVRGMRWDGRLELRKVAQALEHFYLDWLTIFGNLDLGALMLPNDSGWRWTDHIADYVSIITFIEFLWAGSILEGDLFCREMWQTIVLKYLNFQTDTSKGENSHVAYFHCLIKSYSWLAV